MNRLIRYETALARKGVRAAFGSWQDVVLLALMAMLGIAYLTSMDPRVQPSRWDRSFILAALAPWLFAFTCERLLRTRLNHFIETPLAADALEPRSRQVYRWAGHGLALVLIATPYVALVGHLLGEMRVAAILGILSYSGGVLTALLIPPAGWSSGRSAALRRPSTAAAPRSGGTGLFHLVLRIQIAPLRHGIPAAAALVAAVALAAFVATRSTAPDRVEAAAILALLPLFLLMLASSRIDHATMRILPFAGYSPAAVAAAFAAFPAAMAVAVTLAALLAATPSSFPVAAGALLMLAFFLLLGIVRCWLYPRKRRRAADLQVEIELAAFLLLLFFAPPLAVIVAILRLAMLYRAHRQLQWQHP